MTKIVFTLLMLAFSLVSTAQKKKQAFSQSNSVTIPLQAENWDFQPGKVEFIEQNGTPVMKIAANAGKVVLKSFNFTSGTIEFNWQPLHPNFASFYFHYKNAQENECFYFRTQRADNNTAGDAVQYAPFIGGVNLWDMLYHYQGAARFSKDSPNRIKLVISGKQMRAYINASPGQAAKPTLSIPALEGNTWNGTLAFDGEAIISNLVVKPGQVDNLDSIAGPDPTDHDPRYLRNWQVTTPITTPPGIDLNYEWFPNDSTEWKPIGTERMGLVNLTRRFGLSTNRRIVWLKTTITAAAAGMKKLRLGFSDEVWVILNQRLLYTDKNLYMHPIRKEPAGRCTIENTSFMVPLQKGENELIIGVANDFYGWGIIARLDEPGGF